MQLWSTLCTFLDYLTTETEWSWVIWSLLISAFCSHALNNVEWYRCTGASLEQAFTLLVCYFSNVYKGICLCWMSKAGTNRFSVGRWRFRRRLKFCCLSTFKLESAEGERGSALPRWLMCGRRVCALMLTPARQHSPSDCPLEAPDALARIILFTQRPAGGESGDNLAGFRSCKTQVWTIGHPLS